VLPGLLELVEKLEEKDEQLLREHSRIQTLTQTFRQADADVDDFNSLRRNLGNPTARVEVKSLIAWLDESLREVLESNGLSVKEVFVRSMKL